MIAAGEPGAPPWWVRPSTLALLCGAIAVAHELVPTATHSEHVVHVTLRTLYFLPITTASLAYGLWGGVLTAGGVTVLQLVHMHTAWTGNPWERPNQVAILLAGWVVGLGAGGLVESLRRSERRRRIERARAEREAVVHALEGLQRALAYRDMGTAAHGESVADLAGRIAVRLGLRPARIEVLRQAARVHDLGKIGVRDDVLFKPGRLDPDERKRMQAHPGIAAAILRTMPGSEPIAELVMKHHEYLDGSGYPQGLEQSSLPLEVRILTVADIYCALTEPRAYAGPHDRDTALSILEEWRGERLDPEVVDAAVACIESASPSRSPGGGAQA